MLSEMEPLKIPSSLIQAMVEYCRLNLPYEACGLLGGKNNRATKFIPMRNLAVSTTRYEMDPQEQLQAFRALQKENLDLVAIFHSHPVTEAYPSKTDVEFASFWEETYFVILSFRFGLDKPEVRAFRIIGQKVFEPGVQEEEL